MPALIDDDLVLFGGRADWETDPILTPDPSGFDRVKATLCFRGTGTELFSLLAIGSKTCPDYTGKPLYYTGPRVIEARFGYQIAEMEWAGMVADKWSIAPVQYLNTDAYVRSVNIAMTTNEQMFPREVLGNTLYLTNPYAPTAPVGHPAGLRTITASYVDPSGVVQNAVTAVLPWRIRLIGRSWAVRMSGIIAGPRSSVIKPPRCTLPDPTINDSSYSSFKWLSMGDPLVTWSEDAGAADGWVCRNYDTTDEMPLGTILLARWTAMFEWVERYGP